MAIRHGLQSPRVSSFEKFAVTIVTPTDALPASSTVPIIGFAIRTGPQLCVRRETHAPIGGMSLARGTNRITQRSAQKKLAGNWFDCNELMRTRRFERLFDPLNDQPGVFRDR
jgi:hypothetical protein